jgi:hypothetical protein
MKIYYVGMDVHKRTIAIAVLDAYGKLITQSIIETSTQSVRDFFHTVRAAEVHVTFEEGNHAAWLFDVVEPLVNQVVVCNPKHNKKKMGRHRNDRIDARQLAELLRLNAVKGVYHGEHGTRSLKHLMRSYECFVTDIARVKNRLKAIYNSQAIPNRRRNKSNLALSKCYMHQPSKLFLLLTLSITGIAMPYKALKSDPQKEEVPQTYSQDFGVQCSTGEFRQARPLANPLPNRQALGDR